MVVSRDANDPGAHKHHNEAECFSLAGPSFRRRGLPHEQRIPSVGTLIPRQYRLHLVNKDCRAHLVRGVSCQLSSSLGLLNTRRSIIEKPAPVADESAAPPIPSALATLSG